MAGTIQTVRIHRPLVTTMCNPVLWRLHVGKQCTNINRCHWSFLKLNYSYSKSLHLAKQHYPKWDYTRKAKEHVANQQLQKLNRTDQEKLRYLQLEYELWKAEGQFEIPGIMGNSDWIAVMTCQDAAERLLMYSDIKQKQDQWLAQKLEEQKHEQEIARLESKTAGLEIQHGSCIYLDMPHLRHTSQLLKTANERRGLEFGRPILFDFSGQKHDQTPNASLTRILQMNQSHPEPCHVHFTGCNLTSSKQMSNRISSLCQEFMFLQPHTKSSVGMFPKDRLVVVTNMSPNVLEDSYTYIPVFMVQWGRDKLDVVRYADRHGIRHAAIPLHKYIRLPRHHTKFRYTLQQMVGVLLDLNFTHNWVYALLNNMPEDIARHCHNVQDLVHYIQDAKRQHSEQQLKIPR